MSSVSVVATSNQATSNQSIIQPAQRATPPKMTTSWCNSKARQIIIQDLEEQLLPLGENEMSAKEAWDTVYQQYIAEFANVSFLEFNAHLKDHRKQVRERLEISLKEEIALAHNRRLHPRQTHNHCGEPVFDLSPAKQCLRDDVKNKLHPG
jgi:hypothetical protein